MEDHVCLSVSLAPPIEIESTRERSYDSAPTVEAAIPGALERFGLPLNMSFAVDPRFYRNFATTAAKGGRTTRAVAMDAATGVELYSGVSVLP